MSIVQQYLTNPCSITHTRTVSSNTTNLNAQTLFGSDFTANSCKNLIIDSGVSIGGTDLFFPALDIPAGMGGSMKIINNGSILGAGGKGGQWTQGSGFNDSACTTRGGGRLLLCTNTSYENEDGTNNDSNLVYGRPGAFLFDLNGNFIKRLNVPINNPSLRSGAYATRVAIGGDRMFVGINQGYNASQTYWPSEGFHIYDLNGNLLSNGTAIRHGNATSEWCSSIAANENYVVIGDRGMGSCTFGGYCAPGVYVYNHSGTHIANWRGTDTGANGYDGFGWSVDINEANDIVVGASMKHSSNTQGYGPYVGAVYYFPNFSNSGQVKMQGPATPYNGTSGGYPNHPNGNPHFGRQVKIGKSTIMTSAPFCRHHNDVNPSQGAGVSELGEVSFWNFSGQLLANRIPQFTHDPTNKNDGYRFGSYGIIKPTPEPSTGDEYWLAATSGEGGWQQFWQNQQYIAMFDQNFDQVGTFACRNSYSITVGGTFESDSGMCMTPAGADYPRVFIAGGTIRVNQNKGSIMIYEHEKFRPAPTAVPMPGNSSGYVEVWDVYSPDVNNVVNQAGILTGGNYLKWHYIMRGEDGGDAIRCNSANVGINNQGTIYGGGGGGGSGCKQYVSGSYDEGKGGKGGNGQGYNQSQTNAPSSSIQQGGNGGTYGNDGVRGTGDGIGIPTSYGDRVRTFVGWVYNHRKFNFKRSPILSHDGGQAGFIVTSTNNSAVEFFNNGTRGGRL